jgi:hypothetical protein
MGEGISYLPLVERIMTLTICAVLGLCVLPLASFAQAPNTQPETIPLLSHEQALASVQAPEGFDVSLFAAEPDVRQPIGYAFDTRGRLWVAECYTYAENGAFDEELHDRIVILEDTNRDGQAELLTQHARSVRH